MFKNLIKIICFKNKIFRKIRKNYKSIKKENIDLKLINDQWVIKSL